MNIKTFYCNPYRECTYVITSAHPDNDNPSDISETECLIIDPGMYGDREEQRVWDYLAKNQLKPIAILITHQHPDHICGREALEKQYGNLPVYGSDFICPAENEQITLAGMTFTMLRTPGHKEDSICFYFETEKIMFTGDTIFQESIGRTDLPGGDFTTLINSLHQLMTLPDDTQLYPGHGLPTTIAHEKQFNPFL